MNSLFSKSRAVKEKLPLIRQLSFDMGKNSNKIVDLNEQL
jgi:hypothetical protein